MFLYPSLGRGVLGGSPRGPSRPVKVKKMKVVFITKRAPGPWRPSRWGYFDTPQPALADAEVLLSVRHSCQLGWGVIVSSTTA